MIKNKYVAALLSIFPIINCIICPIYSIYGGLFPNKYQWYPLDDVLEYLFVDGDCSSFIVIFTMFFFVSSLINLFVVLCDVPILAKWLSAIEIITAILFMMSYANQREDYLGLDLISAFDFEDGHFAIGFWIGAVFLALPLFYANRFGKAKNVDYNNNKTTEELAFDIQAIERAIEHYKSTPSEANLLQMAGSAYFNGTYNAPKDYDKAIDCFRRSYDLGNIESLSLCGKIHMLKGLDNDDRLTFILGVTEIYEAYKKGFTDAKKELKEIVDSGFFENVSSVEDLCAVIEENSIV